MAEPFDPTGARQTVGHTAVRVLDEQSGSNIVVDDTITISPAQYLLLSGAFGWTTTTVNSVTYSIVSTDFFIAAAYTATGSMVITIPSDQITTNRVLYIKDAGFNAGTNNITINTGGSETIDGETSLVLNSDKQGVWLIEYDGNLLVF